MLDRLQRLRVAILSLAAVLAVGCGGGDDEARAPAKVTDLEVALDFTPNAVHAPLYMAARDGSDRRRGLRFRIRQPGSGPDALKLLAAGRIDVGILDIHDLGLAREKGVDIVGIGALVQKPLAALIAQPEIRRPRDLAGRRVGVSGLPSDPAFLKGIVEADTGDYGSIRQVTIGFAAVSALLARKVDAVPAFWNAEGVALRHRGRRTREFRVERYGAPAYPEVVFMTTRRILREQPDRLRSFLAAVADGIKTVQSDPDAASAVIADAAKAGDRGLVRAQLDAVLPLFSPPLRLDRGVLERWADFDARIGILKRRPDIDRAFDFALAPR